MHVAGRLKKQARNFPAFPKRLGENFNKNELLSLCVEITALTPLAFNFCLLLRLQIFAQPRRDGEAGKRNFGV